MEHRMSAMEEHILGAAKTILREQLPNVEKALVVAQDANQAKIAIDVVFKLDTETGDYELRINGKSSLPSTAHVFKARIENAQLTLI